MKRLIHLSAVLLLATACPGPAAECTAADECAADEVCRSGQCEAADDVADAGADVGDGGVEPDVTPMDGGSVDGGGTVVDDGGTTPTPDPEPTDGGSSDRCIPNHDGVITAQELPVALGFAARYIATGSEEEPVDVDLVGEVIDDVRTWRLDGTLAGDTPVSLGPVTLPDMWFGDDFAEGDYAAPLDAQQTAWGVFKREGNALLLLGVASDVEEDTLLIYDPPVTTAQFPLQDGDTFSSTTSVSGTFEGNPFYLSTDTWTVTVDGRGNLLTPAGTYDVLRVRTVLELSIPIAVFPFSLDYRYVRYAFLTECLGQAAYVASTEDEEQLEFTSATEVRRLGLP